MCKRDISHKALNEDDRQDGPCHRNSIGNILIHRDSDGDDVAEGAHDPARAGENKQVSV